MKGADKDNYSAGLVSAAVLWLGHLEVILKGDNEPALQALVGRCLEVLRVKAGGENGITNISKEDPAPYDSQGNGGTEVGVMILRGLFRTLKL